MVSGHIVSVNLFCHWNEFWLSNFTFLLLDTVFCFLTFHVCDFKEGKLMLQMRKKENSYHSLLINSLLMANISLDQEMLLLCFYSSFRFVYQYHVSRMLTSVPC